MDNDQNNGGQAQSFIPNYYARFNVHGMNIDTYRIFRMYEVIDPCLQHAIKKLLRCGRSHKSREQDIQDAIDTLFRLQKMDSEDEQQRNLATKVFSVVDQLMQAKKECEVQPTITVEYIACKPGWREDVWAPDWDGPGWYIVRDPGDQRMFSTKINGPYLTREMALASTKKWIGGFGIPTLVTHIKAPIGVAACEGCGYELDECRCSMQS